MPGSDDRAADSLTPEPLRRTDPPHGPLAAEPSLLFPTPERVKKRVAAGVGCASSDRSRNLAAWSHQATLQQGMLHQERPPRESLRRPLPADNPIDADEGDFAASEALLRLHATELIDRLQEWSRDLDARQSQLNLQSASQDQRERQFRLWTQAREAELQERLRVAEERDKELRESAHRLALAELGNAG